MSDFFSAGLLFAPLFATTSSSVSSSPPSNCGGVNSKKYSQRHRQRIIGASSIIRRALRQYNRRNDPIRRGQTRYDGIPQELDVLCATGEIGTMVFHKSELIGSFSSPDRMNAFSDTVI